MNDLVEFNASVTPADILMQAVGTTLVLKDQTNGGSLDFLGAAGTSGGPVPSVGRVEFADGTVWDLRQHGLTFKWDGSAGKATITSSPFGSNTVVAGPGDTLVGSSSHSLYQIGYGVENLTILPGPADTISFGRGVSSSNIEFQTQGSDLLILSSDDGHVIADIKGDLNRTQASGLTSAVGSLLFADGTSLALSAVLTYTWNDPAGGATLTVSPWGNNYFDLGVGDTVDSRPSPYQNTYLYRLSDGDTTILPGGNDVIKFTSEVTPSDVSWAAVGNNLVVTLLSTGKRITVVGDRLLTGEAVLRFADGTTIVPDLSSTSGPGTLSAPAGPPPATLSTWVGTVTDTTLVGSNSTPNAFQLGAGGDSVTFGNGSQGGLVQNTVYFDKGNGAASVYTEGSPGVLHLDDDINASDVVVQADSMGRLVVTLRDDAADSITFNGDMHGLPGTRVSSDVTGIVLGDGSTIDLTSPSGPTSTWVGEAKTLWLSGTGYGPNVFEIAPGSSSLLGQGQSLVYFGKGDDGGSNQNRVSFGRGSGNATVYTNGAPGVLYLGPGITASDVLVQVNVSGWLTIALRDDPADSITFRDALSGSAAAGVHSTISSIALADGSTLSLSSLLGPISTWTGSSNWLDGSQYGANVFELAPGDHYVSFGAGSQGGSNQNTVHFDKGNGAIDVYTNNAPGVLYLGRGIAASDVLMQVDSSGDLTVALRDDPADSISFYQDVYGSAGTGLKSWLSSIVLGDGSTISLSSPSGPTSTWVGTATGSEYGPNVFDVAPGTSYIWFGTGSGGGSNQNTVYFDKGDGAVSALTGGSPGVLYLGADIAASDVVLQTSFNGQLLVGLRDDPADNITFYEDLNGSPAAGVSSALKSIVFADGSTIELSSPSGPTFTWIGTATNTYLRGFGDGANVFDLGPGGDTVYFGTGDGGGSNQNSMYFDKGDGAAFVVTGAPGVLHLGADIAASDVIIQNSLGGYLTVALRDDLADSITFQGDLQGSPATGVSSELTAIVLGDGSTINLSAPSGPTFTWVGSAAATRLYGSGYGANVFDLGAGDDTVDFGTGANGGSSQNTVYFGKGDGAATVNVNGAPGVLYLGSGFAASDVVVQVGTSGDLTVALRDDPADSIIFRSDVYGTATAGMQSWLNSIVLANGSTISLASPLGPTSTWIGTATATTLTGTGFGPNVFDLGPGGDTVDFGTGANGGSNQNTVYFGKGDGAATVYVQGVPGLLYLGSGIAASDVTFKLDGIGGVIMGLADDPTDSITLKGDLTEHFGNLNSCVSQISFADGTSLTGAQVISSAMPTTIIADTLIGTSGPDLFDGFGAPTGLQDYEQGNGGADTFVFNEGYGKLEISELDFSSTPANTLQLGAGITAAQVGVTADSAGNLYLTDGIAGDQITIDSQLSGSYYGVQKLAFADGTSWSRAQLAALATTGTSGADLLYGTSGPDVFDGRGAPAGTQDYEQGGGGGDTFVFNQGYGKLEISELDFASTPANTLQLGAGITAAQLGVTADSAGNLYLTDGTAGDQVTIDHQMGASYYGVQMLAFADGTSWTGTQLTTLATTGTVGADLLYGSSGADLFDGKGASAGSQDYESGGGGGDTFAFNSGYGHLEISEYDLGSAPANVIKLGAGVQHVDVKAAKSSDGSSVVLTIGGSGDQVTIDNMLLGSSYGVQSLQFSDGTSWTAKQIDSLARTGSTKADIITGTTGNDVFDGRGGADTITGKGGSDIYLFRKGYGHLTINNAQASGTTAKGELDFGSGITEKNLWFANSGGDLNITVLGSQDLVTVKGWFGAAASQLAEVRGYDGLNLDTQTSNLVSAMATYASNHAGFNPTTATQIPTDSSLQAALNAAWHH